MNKKKITHGKRFKLKPCQEESSIQLFEVCIESNFPCGRAARRLNIISIVLSLTIINWATDNTKSKIRLEHGTHCGLSGGL